MTATGFVFDGLTLLYAKVSVWRPLQICKDKLGIQVRCNSTFLSTLRFRDVTASAGLLPGCGFPLWSEPGRSCLRGHFSSHCIGVAEAIMHSRKMLTFMVLFFSFFLLATLDTHTPNTQTQFLCMYIPPVFQDSAEKLSSLTSFLL